MKNTHWRSSVKKCLKQFHKIYSKTCELKSLFNKFAGLMAYNFIRKKLRQRLFVVSFPFRKFWKDLFCRTYPSGCLNEMNQKKLCLICSQENNGKDVLFSAVADMWAYNFSKRDSITDAFLWKLWSFTERHFYRTLLCDCFWFPVTFSIYRLFYQQ